MTLTLGLICTVILLAVAANASVRAWQCKRKGHAWMQLTDGWACTRCGAMVDRWM